MQIQSDINLLPTGPHFLSFKSKSLGKTKKTSSKYVAEDITSDKSGRNVQIKMQLNQ